MNSTLCQCLRINYRASRECPWENDKTNEKRGPLSTKRSSPMVLSRAILPLRGLRCSHCHCYCHCRPPMAHFSSTGARKLRLRGVVFDMDGTLTVPVIDFAAMYRAVLGEEAYVSMRAKNPSGIDILHHIERWSPDRQQNAYEIIADYEKQGLDRLQIMPEKEFLALSTVVYDGEMAGFMWLKPYLATGVIRNVIYCRHRLSHVINLLVKQSDVEPVGDRCTRLCESTLFIQIFYFDMEFSPALSREFRPYKPDPAPLLHICSTWGVQPDEVIMIGDSLKDDVACGKRAGAFTCLLDEKGQYDSPDLLTSDLKPDFKVHSLSEVHSLLVANFELMP
ncbi:hypothetical protein ACLOJK_011176 [Asimina triloba]